MQFFFSSIVSISIRDYDAFFFFSCCENIALARLGVILRISSGFDYEYVSFIAEDELLHKITSWV